ncbi:Transcription initiation factor TFIID 150 kDa subunit [Spraguea lophii 42_110]|uniref:Transcription initiation factor TFIID subunit 2 n=1 Tax=Spraguea lophii (strain 42_110) TaxID=1358809 RepID=S7XT19_SPRLO|nr:Transcription initiation factor TFIID 150 kDa subunit [Spraguea lophii 42_110]
MKLLVTHQKNVYYFDIDKKLFNCYVEMSFLTTEKTIDFEIGNYEIKQVILNGCNAEYTINNKILKVDMSHNALQNNNGMVQLLYVKDYAYEQIKETEKNINIIKIILNKHNGIEFYYPFLNNDRHREALGCNYNYKINNIFPYPLNYMKKHDWDLVYIVPQNLSVVSPGILEGIEEGDKNIYLYKVNTFAGAINFCIGNFEAIETVSEDDRRTAYLPQGYKKSEKIKEMGQDFLNIIKVLESFVQSTFTLNFSLVFSFEATKIIYGEIIIIPLQYLEREPHTIENDFNLKEIAAEIISSRITPLIVTPESDLDWWISMGLSEYLTNHILRYIFGNNEYLYNIKKDLKFVCNNDRYEYPLYDHRRSRASCFTNFFKKKSGMFFYILENNSSKAFMKKIVKLLIETVKNTTNFIKLVRDVTGLDLKRLFDFYIFNCGVVDIFTSFEIDKKKGEVRMFVKQRPTSYMVGANKRLSGTVRIISCEIDGIIEHNLPLDDGGLTFNYHTRSKKAKRKDEKDDEQMGLMWIRVDPNMEHMCIIHQEQPEYMILDQLKNDKNVISQIEAIENLKVNQNNYDKIEKIINDQKLYFRVRIELLYQLARSSINREFGYQKVIQYFIKKFCIQGSTIVKNNDFSVFSTYFIQSHIPKALSITPPEEITNTEEKTKAKNVILAFLLNILKYNDNTFNTYSDIEYISSTIKSITYQLYPFSEHSNTNINNITTKLESLSTEEIDRYRKKDLLFPSHANLLTHASLFSLGKLKIYNLIEIDQKYLRYLLQDFNYYTIRMISAEILILNYLEENIKFLLFFLKDKRYFILHILKCIEIMLIYDSNNNNVVQQYIDTLKIEYTRCYDTEIMEVYDNIFKLLDYNEIQVPREELDFVEHEFSSEEEDSLIVKLKTTGIDRILLRIKNNKKIKIKNNIERIKIKLKYKKIK